MSKWKLVKLGDVLTESKVESMNPSTSRRIRVRLNTNGIEKRPNTNEKVGSTKYFIRTAGQFIYGRQNLHKGAFGIVPNELDGFESSLDIPAFDVSNQCLSEWIELFLKQGNYYLKLEKIASGVGSKRISPKRFLELEIPLPDINEQKEIIERASSQLSKQSLLKYEVNSQQNLLKKLRQQILQDAIEGKLTKDWREKNPDVEPASELLKRIQAEKEQLIKDKKLKKQKALPVITDDEKPFVLPESWEWCRLGQITQIKGGKRVSNGYKLLKKQTPYIYIRVSDMKNLTISDKDLHYIDSDMRKKIERYIIRKDDLYIVIVGGTIGKCGSIPSKFDGMNLTENAARIILFNSDKQYLLNTLSGIFCQNQFSDRTKRVGVQKMALNRLKTTIVSFPPLQEQKEIVKKVEKLFAICDQLEEQITSSQTNAEQLMQSVLKEAFSQESAA
jgi:restriction endonuclease S subunit